MSLQNYLDGKADTIPESLDDDDYDTERVFQYSILKHAKYALMVLEKWENILGREQDLLMATLFLLIVHGYDEKAKYVLEEFAVGTNFKPLKWFKLDDFPAASHDMCLYLHQTKKRCPYWCYYVSGWSIMKGYTIEGLYYGIDHQDLAMRYNRTIVATLPGLQMVGYHVEWLGFNWEARFSDTSVFRYRFEAYFEKPPTVQELIEAEDSLFNETNWVV